MVVYLKGYPIFLVLLRILLRKHYFDIFSRGINEVLRVGHCSLSAGLTERQ